MKKFRVLVNGSNLLLRIGGEEKRVGFFTTRLIEAESADEAGRRAVNSIVEDRGFRARVSNADDDPPVVRAEKIESVCSSDEMEDVTPGFAFYHEEAGEPDG